MALVIVLAVFVLVLGLCVGFLSRVSTERNSSKRYASSIDARLLADTAVQIVQGQIDSATTQGTGVAWSSQPGLVRTYDSSGKPLKSYKLYSSATMQPAGALDPAAEAASLAGWFGSPALYTDLNAPEDFDFDGAPDIWPILDPTSLQSGSAPEGFGITGAPAGLSQGIANPAPMPAGWLYVLKDGSIVAPVGSGNMAAVAGATAQNPIVGRIAFWTDDESCKVNINTASEGTYWDVPRARNKGERELALYQPTQGEYQAFPGHPATTSLSAVFPGLSRDQIFTLVPRLQNRGSKDGTVDVTKASAVILDKDRLYPSAAEMIFDPDRAASAGVDKGMLERAKFFLTATSRAPETNLFNLPKVACWPLHADLASNAASPFATAFDRLIARCATINGQPYFFQRRSSTSQTDDYAIPRNPVVYGYLSSLLQRPVPGFGASLGAKWGTDRDQILTEAFDYIRCTNLNDLGLAADKQFAAATDGKTMSQGEVVPIKIGSTRGAGRYLTVAEATLWIVCTADAMDTVSNDPAANLTLAENTPLAKDSPANTKQIRIEAALLVEPFCPMLTVTPIRPDVEILVSGLENLTVRGNGGGAAVNFGFPSQAEQTYTGAGVYLLGMSPTWTSGANAWGGHLGMNWALDAPKAGRQVRARNGGRLKEDAEFADLQDNTENSQYPFVSEPATVTVSKTSPMITLASDKPGALSNEITVILRQRTTGRVIQTIPMALDFPNSSAIPAPTLPSPLRTFQAGGCGVSVEPARARLAPSPLNYGNDVLYSLVPASGGRTGDPRLVAMSETVDAGMFKPHPSADGTNRAGNSLISLGVNGAGIRSGNKGTLADLGGALHPAGNPMPKAPFVQAASQTTGDWDNGLADQPDGGYLNASDGGNQHTSFTPYFTMHSLAQITFTSPNRIMPSPGMFGSLPTGVKRSRPWETLLFRRQPGHPNYPASAGSFASDPDYLFLDLFWMPVVEPYAISEPLSTAGKVNMNYQIVPFTWIERSTGLHAVLEKEKVVSIPAAAYALPTPYKISATYQTTDGSFADGTYRHGVNIPATLEQFRQRFDNSDGTGFYAFRTAAEICDIHIVPDNASADASSKAKLDADMAKYWAANALTGDNTRERVYTTVYPRLTTKSNTFTVHFRAQALRQLPGSTAGQWVEGKDQVAADYRGSATIERYVDPADASIPDYAANPSATPVLDSFYHWRVRSVRQFAP